MTELPPQLEVVQDPPPAPRPDPGSRLAARIALIFAIILIPAVVVLQQMPEPEEDAEPDAQISETLGPAPTDGAFEIQARLMLKIARVFPGMEEAFLPSIQSAATSPGDEIRLAIATERLVDIDHALNGLEYIDPGEDDELAADIGLFQVLYADGSASLSDEQRERIETRYGWFGELSLQHDAADTTELDAMLAGGGLIITLLAVFFVGLGIGFVGGIVLLILAIIQASNGNLRSALRAPIPGGSVYLEMFVVFVGTFLLIQIIGGSLAPLLSPANAVRVPLLLQWCMVGVLFYPMLRGVSLARVKHDLGWHAGKGIFKEIGAGLIGYIAGIPVYLGSVLVAVVLMLIWSLVTTASGEQPAGASNPIFDIVENTGPIEFFLFFTLATIWAPLMEETIFRGGLFRHIQSRLPWVAAAFFSAVLFGLMHGYFVIMLIPIVMLGVVFAALRQWRGSLIAPMTAHFIHNFVTLGFVTILVRVLAN